MTTGTIWGLPWVLSLLFYPPQTETALDHHWTCHIAIQPDPTGAANLSEPQFRKSTAITTAELLLINVWNEGDLKRRPMLIKCNCLIAKCWEPILRGFQWNYLISSQEVHCRKRQRENGRAEKARNQTEIVCFSSWAFPSWMINCGLHLVSKVNRLRGKEMYIKWY